ncbi:hypothetical protein psyc5s11_00800 [Clostridium gelidum]|uniref:Transmembrane protein n=1 Tax=Clostridium gelidum TaxID=704125 RepID=A0ABM7SZB4_9CLOT|nr:hypothetical protein [Clostridium gelidum]BCZ44013.1 hypothetical protein psyc5s11_00800 [Clostridium gelidum]
MAHNKLYRNFIILQEDERGYSHSNDKALSGYAKVEAKGDKCKVSFYAQNLKQEDNYSMVLICCKRDLKQLIDLGPLAINGVGKGDTSKEYYVNNIAGIGMSYEKISGAAICKVKDNETEFIMHGFMNGEDSTDNWRKFKVVKVDSKKYINKPEDEPRKHIDKFDIEPKKKEILSSGIADKAIISQANIVEAKIVEARIVETSELESGLVERKKDEKENKEVGVINVDNSKVEDKAQNRITKNDENIAEDINVLEEDRNKCKEAKKCVKCEKHENIEGTKKCIKHEMNESIEEVINKVAKKLDDYDGVIDLRINNLHEDIIIYGFVRDKKNDDCKWKKFKIEKKCRNDNQHFDNIQGNSRRIEENFKLDKLNETSEKNRLDRIDRLDIVDFDEYENDIQKAGSNNIKQQPSTDNMKQPNVNSNNIQQPNINSNMQQVESGNIQQATSNESFKMNGEVGQYFEKLAEDFEPYKGSLTDINYCKLYKINVKSIEDLCDESNYNKYTLAYYPMLNYYPYISKSGNFLLGYKCNTNGEIKYIVYGIPGGKEKNDQPYGGRTGFVTWTSDDENDIGYWLMFYDFNNSSIVIPTK